MSFVASVVLTPVPTSLAVVPIVVNAGAAILPAVIAGVGSVVALLFKPRELLRACRRRPMVPVGVAVAGAAVWFGISRLSTGGPVLAAQAGQSGAAAARRTDWAQVALDLIDREQ